jgi:hypothetical protein
MRPDFLAKAGGQAPFAGQRPDGGHHACMVVAQMVPVPLPENLAAHGDFQCLAISSDPTC